MVRNAQQDAEYVGIVEVDTVHNVAVIVRGDGEVYRVNFGIGCLSMSMHRGGTVVVVSPGLFAGIGSTIVIPDTNETCTIWSSDRVTAEYVSVVYADDLGSSVVIQRKNGEQYALEYGVGCLSIYSGTNILILSPYLFAGVGASILVPGHDQSCRVWSAQLLQPPSGTPAVPSVPSFSEPQSENVPPPLAKFIEHLQSTPNAQPFKEASNANEVAALMAVGEDVIVYLAQGKWEQMDVTPFVENGRVFVPVRYLANSVGVQADGIRWSDSTQTVTLTKGTVTVSLTVGKPLIIQNGQARAIDVAPLMRHQRLFLPARFIAEAFEYRVEWNDSAQAVAVYR